MKKQHGTMLAATALLAWLATGSAATGQASQGEASETMPGERLPQIGAAKLDAAPTIDGRVDAREWAGAMQAPPLLERAEGTLDTEPTKVYLGYTEEALYVAWQVHRDSDSPMLLDASEAGYHEGRSIWRDDVIELFFHIDQEADHLISFAGNARGAYGDGEAPFSGATDFAQTWPWDYAARETDFGWEAELSIRFEDLGLDGPPARDEQWRFEVMRNNKTPHRTVSHIAYRDGGRDPVGFPRLTFLGEAPAFKTRSFGPIGDTSMGMLAEVVNHTDAAQQVTVEYAVHHRQEDVSAFNFFAEVDAMVSDVDEGDDEIAAFTDVEQQIAELLGFFEPVAQERKHVEVAPGGRQGLNLTATSVPAGDFLIGYRVVDEHDRVLSAALVPATRWEPMVVEATPYYLRQHIAVRASLHTSALEQRVESFELALLVDDEAVAEKQVAVGEVPELGVALPAEAIDEDQSYAVRVRGIDGEGEVASEQTRQMYRPEAPDWTDAGHGTSSFVPEPWTPVAARSEAVDVWGRTYVLGDSILPEQIISQDEPLFTAPPRLVLKVDGETLPLAGSRELIESEQEFAVYRWRGSAGEVPVSAETRVDFDGFVTVDLDLEPAGATVDALFVELPLYTEHATKYRLGPALQHPEIPSSEIRDGLRAAGAVNDGFAVGFNHALWLGSTERGLEWCAESAEHWHYADHGRVMEVTPKDEESTTLVRLRVVDEPTEADRLSYRWGFAASPVRKYESGASDFRFIQHPSNHARLGEDLQQRIDAALELDANWIGFHAQWNQDFAHGQPFREKESTDTVAAMAQQVRDAGLRVSFYTGWNGLHPAMEDWPYYGEAMRRVPSRFNLGGYKECAYGGYDEYLTAGAVWMIENIHAQGVFLDSTPSPGACHNPLHGCGFVDPDTGVRVPTYDIWARRDMFKRLWRIFNGEVIDDGLIYGHGSGMLAIAAFSTIRHAGESMNMEQYADLAYYRAQYNPTQYGIPVEHSWRRALPVPRNFAWGVSRLHDNRVKIYPNYGRAPWLWRETYEEDDGIDWRMWVSSQWFDWDANPQWHTYHLNDHLLGIDDEEVLASFRINDRNQIVLYVLNMSSADTTATLTFDRKALDLPSQMYGRDVITHETMQLEDGWLELDVLGHRPRMVLIHNEPVPVTGPTHDE